MAQKSGIYWGHRRLLGGARSTQDPAAGWPVGDSQNAADYAAPVVANGVVFVGSLAAKGDQMYALDATSGKILLRFAAGGSVGSHPAVANAKSQSFSMCSRAQR